MSDIVISVGIDSTPAKTGAADVTKSLEDIKRAAADAGKAANTAASGFGESGKSLDELKRQAAEAGKALGDAGAGMNNAGNGAGALPDKVQPALSLFDRLRVVFGESGVAALSARQGYGKLQNMLTGLAAEAAGLPGVFGRLADKLGGFAIGGGVTLAVLAGIAAVVQLFRLLTAEAREAREAQERLIATGKDLAAQYRSTDLGSRLSDALKQVAEGRAAVAALETRLATARQNEEAAAQRQNRLTRRTDGIVSLEEQLKNAREALGAFERATRDVQQDVTRMVNDTVTRRMTLTARELAASGQAIKAALADFDATTAQQLATAREEGQTREEIARLMQVRILERAALEKKVTNDVLQAHVSAAARAEKAWRAVFQAAKSPLEFSKAVGAQAAADNGFLWPLDQALKTSDQYRKTLNEMWDGLIKRSKEVRGLPTMDSVLSQVDAYADKQAKEFAASDKARKDLEDRAKEYTKTFVNILAGGFEAVITGGTQGFKQFFDGLVSMAVKAAAGIAAAMTAESLGLTQFFTDIAKTGWKGFQEAMKGNDALQVLAGGIAGGLVGYGVGRMGNQSKASGAATGGLSGAAAGFVASGFNPLGAAAGFLTGAIGGFLGASQKAKEAAEQLKQARAQFQDALSDWVSVGLTVGEQFIESSNKVLANGKRLRDELIASLDADTRKKVSWTDQAGNVFIRNMAELQKAALDDAKVRKFLEELKRVNEGEARRLDLLRQEALLAETAIQMNLAARRKALAGDPNGAALIQFDVAAMREVLDAIKAGWDEASIAALKEIQALEREALVKRQAAEASDRLLSLEARRLAASGDISGAAMLELQVRQTQEMRAALAEGWSEEAIAILTTVQALEKEKAARDQVAQAIVDAAQKASDELTLQGREARLQGRGLDADKLALQAQAEMELAEARARLARGEITPEFYQRLADVIGGELTSALLGLEAAAKETAARITEDLDLRQARLTGVDPAEVARLELEIRQRRELADAVRNGWSAAQIAQLEYVHSLEQTALAAETAANAMSAMSAKLQEMKAFSDDIEVRYLKSQGKDDEAEKYRLRLQFEEDRKKALSLGLDQTMLDKLDAIYASDLKAITDRYAPAAVANAAAEEASKAAQAESAKVINASAASSIAEGLLSSANVYLREISFNTGVLAGTVGNVPQAMNTGAYNTGTGGTVITVNVTAPAGADAEETGRIIADVVDTRLSQRASSYTSASGGVRVI